MQAYHDKSKPGTASLVPCDSYARALITALRFRTQLANGALCIAQGLEKCTVHYSDDVSYDSGAIYGERRSDVDRAH